jgi:hypothetical protein
VSAAAVPWTPAGLLASSGVRTADVSPEIPSDSFDERGPGRRRTLARIAGGAVFVVGATALQPLRQAGMSMWRTVWAEDGFIFYTTAHGQPLHESILQSYGGYAQVVPRILASVGAQLPADRYSQFVTFSSAFLVALLALFVYVASAPLLRSPVRQGVLAGAMVLLPVLPHESLGAISGIHLFMPLACWLAVLVPVRTAGAIAARLPIVILAPLSSPLAALIAPVAVWYVVRWVRHRPDARSLLVPVAFLSASAVQAVIWWTQRYSTVERPSTLEMVESIGRAYATKVPLGTFVGVRWIDSLWQSMGYGIAALVGVVVVGGLAWKLARASSTSRILILATVGASVATYAFSLYQRPEWLETVLVEPGEPYHFLSMRYEILPALLLIAALLLPVDLETDAVVDPTQPETTTIRTRLARDRVVLGAVAVWLLVAIIPSFRFTNLRSEGPSWPLQIHQVRAVCTGELSLDDFPPDDAPEAEPRPWDITGEEVVVAISPEGWRSELTCDDVAAPVLSGDVSRPGR